MIRESGQKSLLAIYGVVHRFPSGVLALDEVNFELERGEFVALIGPNGSGKSSLLKIMAGLVAPNEGQVRLLGQEITAIEPSARAGMIAYVGSDLRVDFPLRALDAVLMGRMNRHPGRWLSGSTREDLDSAQAAMERAGCWSLRYRDIRSLSEGERQLVSLSRAFAQGARVLLLDEALSKMDIHHQARVGALLERVVRDEGYSVILVSHDLNVATEWANRCIVLQSGRVVAQGDLRDALTPEIAARLYPEASLLIQAHPETGMPKIFFSRRPQK